MDRKKIKVKFISTPLIIYAIIFIAFIGFIHASLYICSCEWWENLWLNFGYGTFASLVVSLLIDIGNTIRNEKETDKQFYFLNSNLVLEAKKLGNFSLYALERYSKDKIDSDKSYKFIELLDLILNEDRNLKKRLDFINTCVMNIREQANNLISISNYNLYNDNINKEYVENLKAIIKTCQKIDTSICFPELLQDKFDCKMIKKLFLEELIPSIDKICNDEVSEFYNTEKIYGNRMITF